jgi:cytochrome c oxidase subunit 4
MAEHATTTAHGTAGDEHHGPSLRVFLGVFVALMILTIISFMSARVFHAMPVVSWTVMMAISCMKATLVISFFMHLIWEANWKYVLTIPASFMSLLIILLLIPDIGRRTHMYSEERWRHAPVQVQAPQKDHPGEHSAPHP